MKKKVPAAAAAAGMSGLLARVGYSLLPGAAGCAAHCPGAPSGCERAADIRQMDPRGGVSGPHRSKWKLQTAAQQ